MGEQLLTLPADRYTAPAGVLIAPRYRSDFDLGTSQVDPLEAAEPESSLRSAPFPKLGRLFCDPLKKLFLTGSACSLGREKKNLNLRLLQLLYI